MNVVENYYVIIILFQQSRDILVVGPENLFRSNIECLII